jgi:hypothetical protein
MGFLEFVLLRFHCTENTVFALKGYRARSHGLVDALMKKQVRHHEAMPTG